MKPKALDSVSRRTMLRRSGLAALGTMLSPVLGSAQASSAAPSRQQRYPELRLINLAGNENPNGPSRAVSLAIMQEVSNSCRYPFREEVILAEKLAGLEGVTPEHIVLGNGCDEILSFAGDCYGLPGGNVVATRPTYLELMRYAEKRGAEIHWVDHTESMHHNLAGMLAAITAETGIVYVCNPDTPTGTTLERDHLRDFCWEATKSCPVFLDEVYLELRPDFRRQTLVDLVHQDLPVIVGRSFSKMHGLAGHRIGYAIARPDIAENLRGRKMSSLNYLGVIAATASLDDYAFHEQSRNLISSGREKFIKLLTELNLQFTPSGGNFVFHRTGIPTHEFQAIMKAKNFLVGRPFPPYDDWCRISIGRSDEMSLYETAMRQVFD